MVMKGVSRILVDCRVTYILRWVLNGNELNGIEVNGNELNGNELNGNELNGNERSLTDRLLTVTHNLHFPLGTGLAHNRNGSKRQPPLGHLCHVINSTVSIACTVQWCESAVLVYTASSCNLLI